MKPPSRAASVFSSRAVCFAQSLRASGQRGAEQHDVLEQKAVDGTHRREGARCSKKKRKCDYKYPARGQTPISRRVWKPPSKRNEQPSCHLKHTNQSGCPTNTQNRI